MDIKLPTEISMGDRVEIPLTLSNNSTENLQGNLQIKLPKGFSAASAEGGTTKIAASGNLEAIVIPAKQTKTIFLSYNVSNVAGKDTFAVAFTAKGIADAFEKELEIVAKGFPSAVSMAGQDLEKTFEIDINEPIEGTVKAVFQAYPNTVADMMSGLEGMLRQPYGCFEQTSSTTYPNILVMNYLKETNYKDAAIMAKAENLIKAGYQKLTSFETQEKGYEWFGGTPAHEALTAYGIMEFKDMQGVYANVDNAMIDRTTTWLLGRRDGKGGFLKSQQALDDFGRADAEITNAYIVYALAEAGVKDIDREIENSYQKALASDDAYQLGLVGNALLLRKDGNRAAKVLEKLLALQKANGAWTGKKHSITCSYGQALDVETTSLAILAILQSKNLQGLEQLPTSNALNKATKFLVSSRSFGSFGNTQSTILALKALVKFAKYAKKTEENGTIEIYIDNKKVATQSFLAGRREEISLTGWEKSLTKGKHDLQVKYVGCKTALPYSIGIEWNTNLPNSQKECKVGLQTDLASNKVKIGENLRLTTTLQNRVGEGLPMTLAIVGVPAGLGIQAWQLKELQEKKVFDFYEVIGNNVVFYYRQLKPNEAKTIHLDLKAELAGEYEAAASSAFLYYTNELKTWVKPERVKVGR
jgi:alpha-2-macroglobulin-like protein